MHFHVVSIVDINTNQIYGKSRLFIICGTKGQATAILLFSELLGFEIIEMISDMQNGYWNIFASADKLH